MDAAAGANICQSLIVYAINRHTYIGDRINYPSRVNQFENRIIFILHSLLYMQPQQAGIQRWTSSLLSERIIIIG